MSGRRRLLGEESESESSGEQMTLAPSVRRDLNTGAISLLQSLEFDGMDDPVKIEQIVYEMGQIDEERARNATEAGPSSARPQLGRPRTGPNRGRQFTNEEWIASLRGLPSLTTIEDVCHFIEVRNFADIEFLIPGPNDRPWRAPEGYFTVYEAYFLSGLKFPLPRLLVDYCHERQMALSQLSASAVYNIIVFCDMASECGIEVDLQFLEECTSLSKCKDYPGGYYLSMKHNIICGAPNKIYNWKYRYFWVKMDRASLVEGSRPIRHTWNGIVDRPLIGRPYRENFLQDVKKIWEFSYTQFPTIVASREKRRLAAINNMADRGNDGNRKRKAGGGGRPNPPKRPVPNTQRPPSTMRSLIDRGQEARERAAAEKRARNTAEYMGRQSSEMRGPVSLGQDNQRSQDRSLIVLPDPPEQRMESHEIIAASPPRVVDNEENQMVAEEEAVAEERASPIEDPVDDEERVVAEERAPSPIEDPADPATNLALVETNPPVNKGKAVATDDDHPTAGEDDAMDLAQTDHLFDSYSANTNFLQFRYDGPEPFCVNRAGCSELVYSIRGSVDPYPRLQKLTEKDGYERLARAQVRCMAITNEVIACYDLGLADARKEAEREREKAEKEREAAEKEREESARLRAENQKLKESNDRLKNRLRYLKEISGPSVRTAQIRGTFKTLAYLRERKNIDIPQDVMDKLAQDMASNSDEVKKVAVVELDDEDLL